MNAVLNDLVISYQQNRDWHTFIEIMNVVKTKMNKICSYHFRFMDKILYAYPSEMQGDVQIKMIELCEKWDSELCDDVMEYFCYNVGSMFENMNSLKNRKVRYMNMRDVRVGSSGGVQKISYFDSIPDLRKVSFPMALSMVKDDCSPSTQKIIKEVFCASKSVMLKNTVGVRNKSDVHRRVLKIGRSYTQSIKDAIKEISEKMLEKNISSI